MDRSINGLICADKRSGSGAQRFTQDKFPEKRSVVTSRAHLTNPLSGRADLRDGLWLLELARGRLRHVDDAGTRKRNRFNERNIDSKASLQLVGNIFF